MTEEFTALLRTPSSTSQNTQHKWIAVLVSTVPRTVADAETAHQPASLAVLPQLCESIHVLDSTTHVTKIERTPTFVDLFALKLFISTESQIITKIRECIVEALKGREVDVALFDEQQYNSQCIRLAAFDMDSCILAHECIDELAEEMGVSERVKHITRRAMAGELDFDDALRERVSLLAGMKESQLNTVWLRLLLNPGAVPLMKTLHAAGIKIALVSGGFSYFAFRVASRLGIDYPFSNVIEVDQNKVLTGRVVGTIVNGNTKEVILICLSEIVRALAEREGIPMHQVLAMGDGANDQYMIRAAGIGIAYHAKAILKAATPHHIDHTPLHSLVHFANISVPSPGKSNNKKNSKKVRLSDMPVFMKK